jgi:hypothetical protein
MKAIIVMCLVLLLGAGIVSAQDMKSSTIKGEVIDISCYLAAGAKGMEHKDCATTCMKAGQPAGILETGTGNIYLAVTSDHMSNPAMKLLPFVAKEVEVTGAVSEKNGMRTIDIKEIKETAAMEMPAAPMEQKGY